MSEKLDQLATRYGIELEFRELNGTIRHATELGKRAALRAMGVATETDEDIEASLSVARAVHVGEMKALENGVTCFMPDWLDRTWGVSTQVYSLRSERNWGMGDFEDLARYSEIAAEHGADFVGVNPLSALFFARPEHFSPFSPSNRQFLNPLYIAVDRIDGADELEVDEELLAHARACETVDYRAVAALKKPALIHLFERFRARAERGDEPEAESFETFSAHFGQPLYLHALFETLSEFMVQQGHGAGWYGWPEEYRHPGSDSVRAFAEEQAERVAFHVWLQWHADRQLGEAQHRACAAGMRIGLYLDLAVGVSSDGSATWSERELTIPSARIGAPPDYFNAAGQDWGLAPLSPATLEAREFQPYRESLDAVLRFGGAVRIDHAMSLYRLFWIPEGLAARDGLYIRYPFQEMLRSLSEVSNDRRAIVIGEDLGVVPPGFRDVMEAMKIEGYRVFFFEKDDNEYFIPPAKYPREALACITIHDLPPLAGWWGGHDLEVRAGIGMITPEDMPAARAYRAHEQRRLLGVLSDNGLLPERLLAVMHAEEAAPAELPYDVAVGLYQLMASTPSRLFVVAVEDLTGMTEQMNLPGTTDEHRNWQHKLPVELERLPELPLFRAIIGAVSRERPRH
ncbi:4-alpha-glucanotransferase [Faunimonas pinastri]|uniref:4-alpha-glucanotransferase n=1 Tax=Faunimonas pinastri TaxID=1855383 RepID=A0A1H9LWH2_9HYPH|nr:4-alpha-glucanotransferase [Faunimonas pinastri]SER15796.1 4-alpha-glucanotransferase [Faunimonas pinastri]